MPRCLTMFVVSRRARSALEQFVVLLAQHPHAAMARRHYCRPPNAVSKRSSKASGQASGGGPGGERQEQAVVCNSRQQADNHRSGPILRRDLCPDGWPPFQTAGSVRSGVSRTAALLYRLHHQRQRRTQGTMQRLCGAENWRATTGEGVFYAENQATDAADAGGGHCKQWSRWRWATLTPARAKV